MMMVLLIVNYDNYNSCYKQISLSHIKLIVIITVDIYYLHV